MSVEDYTAGNLKKWDAQHNILHPEGAQYTVEAELNNEADLSTESAQGADLSLESAQGIDLDELSKPDMLDGLSEQDRLDIVRLSYEDPEIAKREMKEFRAEMETDGSVSYSAKSTLEVRKPDREATTLPTAEELETKLEAAVRTKLPDVDDTELQASAELPDLTASLDEEVPEVQAAIEAELPSATEIDIPDIPLSGPPSDSDLGVTSSVNSKISEMKIEIDEKVTQVQAGVQESAPALSMDTIRGSVEGSAETSDVQIDIPDILQKDSTDIAADVKATTVDITKTNISRIDIEKVAETESPASPSSPTAAVTVEKETGGGGLLEKLGFRKKRRGSSDSASSFSSTSSSASSSSDGGKVDVNRNKGDKKNANIRPSSISSPKDIAFGTELQLPEGLHVEPEERMREFNGEVLEGSKELEVEEERIESSIEQRIESQLIMSEMKQPESGANISMIVNVDSQSEMRSEDNGQEVGEDIESEEEQANTVRSVLKDYFGDKPSLLEQFGFAENKEGSVVRDGGVAFEINETDLNTQPEPEPELSKPKSKGGVAYFVTVDDEKNASLTDPYYYEPPLSNKDDVLVTSTTTSVTETTTKDRAETPDLFASDAKLSDITSLRLETITTTTVRKKTESESPPPAMISLNTESDA